MKSLIVVAILMLICVLLFFQPGGYLIVNNPEKSDALVMLAGDQVDRRYWHALQFKSSATVMGSIFWWIRARDWSTASPTRIWPRISSPRRPGKTPPKLAFALSKATRPKMKPRK